MSEAEPSSADESETQKQARLRRERRKAKIQASGSERLSKITSLSGRPVAAEAETSRAQTLPARRAPTSLQNVITSPDNVIYADPEEVDISTMFRKPEEVPSTQQQEEMLRQLLAGPGPGLGPQLQPNAGPGAQQPNMDDPMMQMMQAMQQMMGAGGEAGGGGPAGPGGLNGGLAGLASLLEGQPAEAQRNDAYIWRILHAVFALALGLYAALGSSFTGSTYERLAVNEERLAPGIFYIFVTAELLLQSSRYFFDKGQLPLSGILGTITRILPEPYSGYIRTAGRYSIIWTTIVADATLIVFVLGCIAWWKGEAAPP